jgi:hypothetical protein
VVLYFMEYMWWGRSCMTLSCLIEFGMVLGSRCTVGGLLGNVSCITRFPQHCVAIFTF